MAKNSAVSRRHQRPDEHCQRQKPRRVGEVGKPCVMARLCSLIGSIYRFFAPSLQLTAINHICVNPSMREVQRRRPGR